MFLRPLIAAAMSLLLSGCTGWWSETRLIPVDARDTAGLEGTFASGDAQLTFSPAAQGLIRATDPAGKEPPSEVAFALLREMPPEPSFSEEAVPDGDEPQASAPQPVTVPDRSYLMEIAVAGDDDKTAYTYAIARISFTDDGLADEVELFSLLCSRSSETFAARKEEQLCIFDDYARLRAAAFDALSWYDDARMVLDTTIWQRETEQDAIASDEMAAPEP
jgi:hypothetical protein